MGAKCWYQESKEGVVTIIDKKEAETKGKLAQGTLAKLNHEDSHLNSEAKENNLAESKDDQVSEGVINYSLLKIPESRILESIFLRDGVFNFSIYPYPSVIDVSKLDFSKEGSTVDIKRPAVYINYDSNNRITKYIGEWNQDKKEGKGVQLTIEQVLLNGELKDKFVFIYEGFWKDNLAEGMGRLIHADGDMYKGNWEKGKASGYGEYIHADGTKYEGWWVNDKQHEEGKEYWNDGSMYHGQYNQGAKHGKGKFVWNDGSVYEGAFNNNVIEGNGSYRWPDGRTYVGQWKN